MVKSKKINVVGVEVLKKNGLDVDKLIKLLVTNASVEFTAYYYFTNLRMHCTGLDGEGVKGIIEDARLEDLSHFESCIERIFQLGGSLPNDAQAFIKMSGCEFLQLPKNPTDMKAILEKCLKAEQGAIVNWNKVCKMTFDKDPATYDIAKDILMEVSKVKTKQFVVGFAADTQNLIQSALEKLRNKKLDLIVANDISAPGIGFQSDNNQVSLIDSSERIENLPRMTKKEIANILLDKIRQLRH